MPITTTTHASFGKGLNAVMTPHALEDGEVQAANNVDFSLENGAVTGRRGSLNYPISGGALPNLPMNCIVRNYNGTSTSLDTSPWYLMQGGGSIYRASLSGTTFTTSSIGANVNGIENATTYQNYAYLAGGTNAYRDNGTNVYPWVIDIPSSAPVIALNSVTNVKSTFTGFNGTWTAEVGTNLSQAGSPWILNTCTTTSSGIQMVANLLVVASYTNTNWENPTTYTPDVGTHTDTSTYTIGAFGVDYLLMGFSDKTVVTRVSRDVSVGDASFNNYWHAETDLTNLIAPVPDPIQQAIAISANSENQANTLAHTVGIPVLNRAGRGGSPSARSGYTPISVADIAAWTVNRTDYQFISGANPASAVSGTTNPVWTNCQKLRFIVETTGPCTIVFGGWQTFGNTYQCLTDQSIGYSYCYTQARLETINGIKVPVAESGPSPFSKPIKEQTASSWVTIGYNTAISTNGATHYGLYRQGGVLNDTYLIDYFPINWQMGIGATTPINPSYYYDGGYADMEIVNNPPLVKNIWGTWSGAQAISEPFQDRIFIGSNNQLWWTAPGSPTTVQNDVQTTVSVVGDPIQGFAVWNNLIIVNQNSVYEMSGSIFEGPNTDWSLNRAGSRRGSVASKTIVKTPNGVLLFGYDGMSLYYPGYGIDTPMDWVHAKIGDAWRGTATTDPAYLKGNRTPSFNLSVIQNACATYADRKIYLAAATAFNGSVSTDNNTVFVFDLATQRVWYYSYPFNITSLFWDFVNNRLMAGTSSGAILQLEIGVLDSDSLGTLHTINWSATTRDWHSASDMILESANVETLAGTSSGIGVYGNIDFAGTGFLGTLTNTSRVWQPVPAISGAMVTNNVNFTFVGSNTTTGTGTTQQVLSDFEWKAIVMPPKVQYWRTDFDLEGGKAEKIWDVNFTELAIQGTGSVTAVTYLDNVAVMTQTYLGPTNGNNYAYNQAPFTTTNTATGPVLVPRAFPNYTYGNIAYTTYTVGTNSNLTFQIFNGYNQTRPEPPRILEYVSDRVAPPSENYVKTWLSQLNPQGGTVLGTLHVDGVDVQVATFTGTAKHTFEVGPPNITTGKQIRVTYNAQDVTKPFKFYSNDYEFEPKPFTKNDWLLTYTKPGGVTQMDMARFNSMDLEATGTATITSTWFADGQQVLTDVNVVAGRQYFDLLSFPPGIRGYIFQQQLTSTTPFKVWRSNLDVERIGVKGFSRRSYHGKPQGESVQGE